MRALTVAVLCLAAGACVASAPPPPAPPPFETGWRFLDGTTAGPADKVEPPLVTARTRAEYPVEARKQRLTGDVGLELTVDDVGNVVKVDVVSPLEPTMDEAAITAAFKWKVIPARLNSVTKASVVRDVVTFAIQ
jgi:TonB family protein